MGFFSLFFFFAKVRFEQMHWSDVVTLDGYTLYLKKTKVYSRHLRCKTLQVPGRTSRTKLLFQISLKVRLSSRHKHQLWEITKESLLCAGGEHLWVTLSHADTGLTVLLSNSAPKNFEKKQMYVVRRIWRNQQTGFL